MSVEQHLPAPLTSVRERSGADRLRTVASAVIGVIAVVLLLLSLVVAWARATVLNSDRFAATVERTLAEPEVTRSLAEITTARLFVIADVNGFIGRTLPEPLAPLAPLLEGAARSLAVDVVDEIVGSPAANRGITEASRLAHRGVMRVLEGDVAPAAVTIDDGAVAVNLLPLITESAQRLQDRGLLTGVEIPQFEWDGDPAQQRDQLGDAIGRELAEDFGQLVVYRSEKISNASQLVQTGRTALSMAQRGALVIYSLTFICAVASLALARRRIVALGALSLGAFVALVLARVVALRIIAELPELFVNPGAVVAVATSVADISRGLITGIDLLALLTLALALGSLVTMRRAATTGGVRSALGALVRERRELVALSGFALSLLIVTIVGLGWLPVLIAIALVVGSVVVLSVPQRVQPNV